jgi:hypothetical protein
MGTVCQKFALLSAICTIAIIKAILPDANSHPIDKTAYLDTLPLKRRQILGSTSHLVQNGFQS